MTKIYPVIMCGGGGSRLWPKSRASTPKQYLNVIGDKTLLQATAERFGHAGPGIEVAAPIIICGKGQTAIASAQLADAGFPAMCIIEEPLKRNTAAVAAVAAAHVSAMDSEDSLLLLLPADHHMADIAGFWAGVRSGLPAAADGYLVTLGIDPGGRPETGYGYIKRGAEIGPDAYKVDKFVEKPNLATAQAYLDEGGFYWNAGIFLFQASAMIMAFEKHAPDILSASRAALERAKTEGLTLHLCPETFAKSPSQPVDTAIMEVAAKVAVIAPVEAGWSDVGSWSAIADMEEGAAPDPARVVNIGSVGCLVQSDGPVIATVGVSDLIIIATGDAVLVIARERAEEVKAIVAELEARNLRDVL